MPFIERRLFFHVDWLLLAAVLMICRDGHHDDLQHDLRDAADGTAAGRSS